MTKKCKKCKHSLEYVATDNRDHKLNICSGDGWGDNEDGSYSLIEISSFDASDCLIFSYKGDYDIC